MAEKASDFYALADAYIFVMGGDVRHVLPLFSPLKTRRQSFDHQAGGRHCEVRRRPLMRGSYGRHGGGCTSLIITPGLVGADTCRYHTQIPSRVPMNLDT